MPGINLAVCVWLDEARDEEKLPREYTVSPACSRYLLLCIRMWGLMKMCGSRCIVEFSLLLMTSEYRMHHTVFCFFLLLLRTKCMARSRTVFNSLSLSIQVSKSNVRWVSEQYCELCHHNINVRQLRPCVTLWTGLIRMIQGLGYAC